MIVKGCFAIQMLITFLTLAIGSLWIGAWSVYHGTRSTNWPSVQGTVLASQFVGNKDLDVSKVVTEYLVDGKVYETDRAPFCENPDEVRGFVRDYPTGRNVKVYYDPSNPSFATLRTGNTMFSFWLLGGGVLLTILWVRFAKPAFWAVCRCSRYHK